jgi:hypothetical protein
MKLDSLSWCASIVLFFFVSCVHRETYYDFAEAERSLKVLNSDLTNFLSTADGLKEIKALKFLYNQESAPLPIKNSATGGSGSFDFTGLLGIYSQVSGTSEFRKTAESNDIQIFFKTTDSLSNCLKILKYRDQVISSKPAFPIEVSALLTQGDEELLTISELAKISDDLPEKVDLDIAGKDYKITGNLNRTKGVRNGKMNLQLILSSKLKTVIEIDFEGGISYSKQGFYFNDLSFKTVLFGHEIRGKIDYANINPTSDDYVKSFNSHSKIEIFEHPGKKVGEIVLGKVSNAELLEFFIKFRNDQEKKITDYIPVLGKFYNFKY